MNKENYLEQTVEQSTEREVGQRSDSEETDAEREQSKEADGEIKNRKLKAACGKKKPPSSCDLSTKKVRGPKPKSTAEVGERWKRKLRQKSGMSKNDGRPLSVNILPASMKRRIVRHLQRLVNPDVRNQISTWTAEYREIVHGVRCDWCKDTAKEPNQKNSQNSSTAENDEEGSDLENLSKSSAVDDCAVQHEDTSANVEFAAKEETQQNDTLVVCGRFAFVPAKRVLGEGSDKLVQLGKDKVSKQFVAIAEFKTKFKKESLEEKFFMEEVGILTKTVGCPNAVKYLGYSIIVNGDIRTGFIVTELKRGSAKQCIEAKGGPFDCETNKIWTIQISEALAWLHHRKIAHRDVKIGNIFISESGCASLGDFGYSKVGGGDSGVFFETWLGTIGMLAPEIFYGKYSIESDIFALGMSMYGLWSGKDPFEGQSKDFIERKCLAGKRPEDWPEVFMTNDQNEYELATLYKRCTKTLAGRRFTAAEIHDHPALQPNNGVKITRLNRVRYTRPNRDDDEDSTIIIKVELLNKTMEVPVVLEFGTEDDLTVIMTEVKKASALRSLQKTQVDQLALKILGFLVVSKRERFLSSNAVYDEMMLQAECRWRQAIREEDPTISPLAFIQEEEDYFPKAKSNEILEPRTITEARELVSRHGNEQGLGEKLQLQQPVDKFRLGKSSAAWLRSLKLPSPSKAKKETMDTSHEIFELAEIKAVTDTDGEAHGQTKDSGLIGKLKSRIKKEKTSEEKAFDEDVKRVIEAGNRSYLRYADKNTTCPVENKRMECPSNFGHKVDSKPVFALIDDTNEEERKGKGAIDEWKTKSPAGANSSPPIKGEQRSLSVFDGHGFSSLLQSPARGVDTMITSKPVSRSMLSFCGSVDQEAENSSESKTSTNRERVRKPKSRVKEMAS